MKKHISLAILLTMILNLIPFATAYSADVLYGDVNGDGVVNGQDVTVIMQKVAGWSVSNYNEAAADVNGDGEVNAVDTTAIMQAVTATVL